MVFAASVEALERSWPGRATTWLQIATSDATREKGTAMPRYIMLTQITPEGARTLHANPNRVAEVNAEIVAFGCSVVVQYATIGLYDFVSVIEAPDNETIAHLSVDLMSRGTAKIMTLPAIPLGDFAEKLGDPIHLAKD